MNRKLNHYCAVCGRTVEDDALAYLLTTNPATSRLTILRWNRNLSRMERARAACEPDHVLEIVAHWMGSGTLDLTFAQTTPCRIPREIESTPVIRSTRVGSQPKPVSELTVNRDSLQRAFETNPQALAPILDSLLEALQRDKDIGPGIVPAPDKTDLLITVP